MTKIEKRQIRKFNKKLTNLKKFVRDNSYVIQVPENKLISLVDIINPQLLLSQIDKLVEKEENE